MDDFVPSTLNQARDEWSARLVNLFTPLVIEGFRSIFNESFNMCLTNNEVEKYLMTFQNLLCRVPKWNSVIVEEERKRIIERSGCNYIEDLITCVHIIQLKVLTSIRVGHKQKKIDISIPKLDHFIHKVYIHAARKIYSNVYLFEKNISPLQIQKNNRELEIIVQECILNAIRDSVPTETIIRAYLDESVEQEEEITIENIENPVLSGEETKEGLEKNDSATEKKEEQNIPEIVPSIKDLDNEPVITRLSFNDTDYILDEKDKVNEVSKPKTIEELEKISMERSIQRKLEEELEDDSGRIKIFGDSIELSGFEDLENKKTDENVSLDIPPFLDFEELN